MSDSKYFKGYIGNVFRMKFFLIIISLFLNQELTKGDKQLNLNQYTLVKGPIVIEGVKANASGLTYSAKRDSLFVVLDQPQRVVEITFDGSLKRKIDLNKFQDTEGIAWVTEDIFAIAEEGKCNIVLTELEPGDGGVSWKKSKKLTFIDGALQSKEREVPEYIQLDDKNKTAKLVRIPKFSEVPFPVIMEPSLVIEYYSR